MAYHNSILLQSSSYFFPKGIMQTIWHSLDVEVQREDNYDRLWFKEDQQHALLQSVYDNGYQ